MTYLQNKGYKESITTVKGIQPVSKLHVGYDRQQHANIQKDFILSHSIDSCRLLCDTHQGAMLFDTCKQGPVQLLHMPVILLQMPFLPLSQVP